MIVLPFYCNLHLIHTFHFHLKYDYSVLKHISPVPSNYREMKVTGSSGHQEGCYGPRLQGHQLPPGRSEGDTAEKWGCEGEEGTRMGEKEWEDLGDGAQGWRVEEPTEPNVIPDLWGLQSACFINSLFSGRVPTFYFITGSWPNPNYVQQETGAC